jgi:hypothetical protein
MRDFDMAVASAVRNVTSRRVFISQTMRWIVGASVVFGSLAVPEMAEGASLCGDNTDISTFGCTCHSSTPNCGLINASLCSGASVKAGHQRCNYWSDSVSGQHCWCSVPCYNGSTLGYYSCCDGWSSATSNCHNAGGKACLCPYFYGGTKE